MIRVDDTTVSQTARLQSLDRLQQAGESRLLLLHRTVLPGTGHLRHEPAGEARQGGLAVTLDVEPRGVPPLVRFLEVDADVLVRPPVTATTKVDAGAAHEDGNHHAVDLRLDEGDHEEVVLNPIGIQMLPLHLVVVQQPPEERMGGCREASLVEVHEQDDVPRRRLRLRFAGGDDPLLRCGERAQESFGHKAIHASGGHVRALPERHGFFFFGGWIRRLDGLAAAQDVATVKAVVAEKVRGPSSPSFISLLFSSL